jgi:murein DD-endopeptidase MepM/ murein hydrolase activator NlpD
MGIAQRTRRLSNLLTLFLILTIATVSAACTGDSTDSLPTTLMKPQTQIVFPTPSTIATIQPADTQVTKTIQPTQCLNESTSSEPDNTGITDQNSENDYITMFAFPIPEDGNRVIESTYRFGSTQSGALIPHDGVEILNPLGTPVLAVADGEVFFAGNDRTLKRGRFTNFYGNIIIIKHELKGYSEPVYSFYAHLDQVFVTDGQPVSSGQEIGTVGASGKAFTNHLHFEVRVGDVNLQNARNPELYLPLIKPDDQTEVGILIGAILNRYNNPITGLSVVVQRVENGTTIPGSSIYLETYAKTIYADSRWNENFVLSNLPVGEYRVSTFANGIFLEQFIEIKPGEVTHIIMKPEE